MKYGENRLLTAHGILTPCNVARWHWFRQVTTVHGGMWLWDHDSELNSPSGSRPTLRSDMWLLDHNDMSLNSPDGSTLQCGRCLWDSTEFAQTSAILEFYFWFWFWPYHHSRHVRFCIRLKNFIKSGPSHKKLRHVDCKIANLCRLWL